MELVHGAREREKKVQRRLRKSLRATSAEELEEEGFALVCMNKISGY